MKESIYNARHINEFIHPFHSTKCEIYMFNKSYYYTDSLENHTELHYICGVNEDYIDALADIFF